MLIPRAKTPIVRLRERQLRLQGRTRAISHVFDVYVSVIMRPRFGAVNLGNSYQGCMFPIHGFTFKMDGSIFHLSVTANYHDIIVRCNCADLDGRGFPLLRGFKFVAAHPYNNFGKLRQQALILVKKIQAKAVYDTMMA